MANQQQVLALPELLEHILLHLPMRDLLFAQKVCKEWQQAINSSPSVQKALCFRPGTQADVAGDPRYELDTPLTASGFAPNQLLLRYFMPDNGYDYGEDVSEEEQVPICDRGEDLICVNERHFSAEASCRRMYMTQPPASFSVDFRCDVTNEEWLQEYSEKAYTARGFKRWNVPGEPYSETMRVEVSDGQTFGALLDASRENVKQVGIENGLRESTWSYGWVVLGKGWEWAGSGMNMKRTIENRQGPNASDFPRD
ncbi:hypothetical protein LTR56_014134 [Elasticomyces elasticus]|nr:hypothetical protein LTR56_014134 [Elasticomyces elasticus]KAK3662741.1 hypothetical protein LTR22_006357 [Elasticomyces elasticus]KAK4918035.1 hypothetical protein LTR49_014173 [Elasticomyces elasticus]KAK5754468.1 hypothetical protein LTS12_015423 [Elasticomyces elasticus]